MHIIRYNRWQNYKLEDADLKIELNAIENNSDAIKERFAIDLSFGTAGMRGIIGVGTNRMNIYTVRRASQGIARFLKKNHKTPSVAVGYDSRIKSDLFAKQAACVLAANGVKVYLYPALQPVPALSFAVRKLKCSAGIVITASHNPAEYNGYKVYGPDGCQINTENAGVIMNDIKNIDIFDDIIITDFEKAKTDGLICLISDEVLEEYYQNVHAQAIRPNIFADVPLSVVYSPLNGSGNVPVRRILAKCGITNIAIVPEQELPDGNFPTCTYPNPEIKETLSLGIQLAEKISADLVLATDPDADRLGIAVRNSDGEYQLMSGNEVGVLLLAYICNGRLFSGTMPKNPIMVKSIVSTPMANAVAAYYNVACQNVLTGFKYIGEYILSLEKNGEEERFVFGFEESYGYLAGTYVRDKDAVVAAMLVCEAAAFYKNLGLTLCDAMNELYGKFGHYLNHVESFEFEGLAGMEKMNQIMAQLRKTPPKEISGILVEEIADYQACISTDIKNKKEINLGLPPSDVLAYTLNGGSIVTVRPSGTEPKIKVYYAIKEKTADAAHELRKKLSTAMQPTLR